MKRRSFLTNAAKTMLAVASPAPAMVGDSYARSNDSQLITLFLCGDVMTGRGIDQIMAGLSYSRLDRQLAGYRTIGRPRETGPG
jgi:hypothetical protein